VNELTPRVPLQVGSRISSDGVVTPPPPRPAPEGPGIPIRATMPMLGHPQQVTVSAGTAFKIGFYAFWGFLVAGLIPWILLIVFGSALLAALTRH
jgi:hypothetical protein